MQRGRLLLPAIVVVALSACATARMDAEWKDSAQAGTSVAGRKVMAVCQAGELTLRQLCQDKLVAQLRALGATIIAPPADTRSDLMAAARTAGAQSLVVTSLASTVAYSFDYGPSVGFGVGGGSGHVGTGIGISFPVGRSYGSDMPTYVSDTSVSEVAQGKLVWSGRASAVRDELPTQIDALVRVSLEAARKAGAL